MYYFIKYGYDGSKFSGFQRGNGDNSVEDSIINTLSEYGICHNIESAARTDRNVSASGNVFLINTERNVIDIMGILNAEIKNMFFHSYATLQNYVNPRYNSMKRYSYILTERHDMKSLIDRLYEFKGTHDFKNFCKIDGRNTIRTIDNISCSELDNFTLINFYGKSFIWHQLRSIMAFVLSGNRDPFSLEKKYPYLAPPEPLVLRDIMYDEIVFSGFDYLKHNRHLQKASEMIKIKYMIYESFNGNI